jgi:hypothetical protein
MSEISHRVQAFELNPSDANKMLLVKTIDHYQEAAEIGRFHPSSSYQRPEPKGQPRIIQG